MTCFTVNTYPNNEIYSSLTGQQRKKNIFLHGYIIKQTRMKKWGGGGGYSEYIRVGVCPGSSKRGVLGAGIAQGGGEPKGGES